MAKRPRYIHAVLLALVRDGYGVELTATYWSSKLLRTCDGNDQTLGQVEHGQGAFQFQPVRSDVRRRVAITATTTNALLSEAATVAVFEMAICKAWVMPYDYAISAAPIGKNFRTQGQLAATRVTDYSLE